MCVAYLLPHIVGASRAVELLYPGEPFRAERAEQIVLVNRVVKATEFGRNRSPGPGSWPPGRHSPCA